MHILRFTGMRRETVATLRVRNLYRERGLRGVPVKGGKTRDIGSVLVSAFDPNVVHLPKRQRETLACLLEGDSEKQVAAHLGISFPTAHQYVTVLYRRFGVRSRAELPAHFRRRRNQLGGRSESNGPRNAMTSGARPGDPAHFEAIPRSAWPDVQRTTLRQTPVKTRAGDKPALSHSA